MSAILTAISIPDVDVVARELHFLPREPIERQELDDVRDQDLAVRRRDVVIRRLDGDVHPVFEVIGAIFGVDGPDVALVKQDQGTAHRGDLHCLENPIENQDVPIEHMVP